MILKNAQAQLGFIPNLYAGLANAPAALQAYLVLSDYFAKTSLTPVEQQVVLLLATSVKNECSFCVAAHSMIAKTMMNVPAEVVYALRDGGFFSQTATPKAGTPLEERNPTNLSNYCSEPVVLRSPIPLTYKRNRQYQIEATLVVKRFGDWVSLMLSRLTSRFGTGNSQVSGSIGQFGVGTLLGLVWLPCVSPTLGAAIALASLGQNMTMAFTVMFIFGIGTAVALLTAAMVSGRLLNRWRPGMIGGAIYGKQILGVLLLVLGVMVITGFDKVLETLALGILPDWAISL